MILLDLVHGPITQVLSFGHKIFFCFRQRSMVPKTMIHTMIIATVMTDPKILSPSLSKILAITSVAVI